MRMIKGTAITPRNIVVTGWMAPGGATVNYRLSWIDADGSRWHANNLQGGTVKVEDRDGRTLEAAIREDWELPTNAKVNLSEV